MGVRSKAAKGRRDCPRSLEVSVEVKRKECDGQVGRRPELASRCVRKPNIRPPTDLSHIVSPRPSCRNSPFRPVFYALI